MASDDRLYSGSCSPVATFAAGDMMAQQMRNFAYLIGDRETGRRRSWWIRPTPPVIC